jgi:hypothetical protein
MIRICSHCARPYRQSWPSFLLDLLARAKPACSSFCNNVLVIAAAARRD